MKQTLKYIFFAILFFSSVMAIAEQDKGLQEGANNNPKWFRIEEQSISRDSILVGDQVLWSTTFTMPTDELLSIEPYSKTIDRDTNGIDVIHDFKLDTVSIKNGIAQIKAKLLFTCFDSGYVKLPQPLIISGNGDTLFLSTPQIAVTYIPIDTSTFVIKDIKGQIRYPITFKEVLPYCLAVLLFAGLIYLGYLYYNRRKSNLNLFGKPIVKDPPHIVALRALDKLRGEKLWQNGKQKLYYTILTDTLRGYIEGRYNVSAMEKTTNEILDSLKDKNIESSRFDELESLFKMADLVKFAKYLPTAVENEEAIPTAVRFVNATFMQQLEEQKSNDNREA